MYTTNHHLIVIFLIVTFSIVSLQVSSAQENENEEEELEPGEVEWNYEGITRANFSDVGLTRWAGGGQSSTSMSGLLSFKKERISYVTEWESRLRSGYGITRLGDRDNRFQKTDDFLILFSKVNRYIADDYDLSASTDFRTQMRSGYRYGPDGERLELLNLFMAPAFLTTSLGVEYSPSDNFSATLSPLSGKTTFVIRDEIRPISDLYGIPEGGGIKHEFGASFALLFNYRLMENIRFENELLLFAGYEDFGKVDVNWETLLNLKVNDHITVSIGTHLIYDEDIQIPVGEDEFETGVQFKRALQAGVSYELF